MFGRSGDFSSHTDLGNRSSDQPEWGDGPMELSPEMVAAFKKDHPGMEEEPLYDWCSEMFIYLIKDLLMCQ